MDSTVRRSDDLMPRPASARRGPVGRSIVLRLAVTIGAAVVMVETYLWYGGLTGPERAIAVVMAVLVDALCVASLHWAWKQHPF